MPSSIVKLDYLFIGSHPDDCEIMAGGTLLSLVAHNRRVGILDLTRGELGSNGSVSVRKKEANLAAKMARISFRDCLGIKDGAVDYTPENEVKIVKIIRKTQPDIIFTFKEKNRHPDHEATHRLVRRAAFMAGLRKYHPPSSKNSFRPSALLYFGEPYYLHDRPDFFVDVSDFYQQKINLISCYSSQVSVGDTPLTNKTLLGSDLFWNSFQAREGWYGALIGSQYAEGFWSDLRPRLKDPLIHFKNSN